jgi:hypothetical protein
MSKKKGREEQKGHKDLKQSHIEQTKKKKNEKAKKNIKL